MKYLYRNKEHKRLTYRLVAGFVAFSVCLSMLFPSHVISAEIFSQAGMDLPAPGTQLRLTESFTPNLIKGVMVHPEDPFRFNFIMDTGASRIEGERLKVEATRLIKYFFAALTVPEDEGHLWRGLFALRYGKRSEDEGQARRCT